MNLEIKARLKWVQLYEETGAAGFVCRRCGISRPPLRKWSRRFKEQGIEGLRSRSRLSQPIKFRPIKPGSSHLNGKVERSQKTDLSEFYPTLDFTDSELDMRIEEWQFFYNWYRPHGSLKGQTPMEKVCGLLDKTPYRADVYEAYDPGKEDVQEKNYRIEMKLKKLKRSM